MGQKSGNIQNISLALSIDDLKKFILFSFHRFGNLCRNLSKDLNKFIF